MYIAAWLVNYCIFALSATREVSRRAAATGSLLLFGLLAILRGSVGTDTVPIYQHIAATMLAAPVDSYRVEWVFWALLYGLVQLTQSPLYAVRGVAVIFVLLLLKFASRASKEEAYYFLAFFIPVLFFPLGFNALRIGLAIGILLLALQYYRTGQHKISKILTLVSIGLHYSACIVFIYYWFLEAKYSSKRFLASGFFGLVIAALFLAFNDSYIERKYHLYLESGYTSPDIYSGASQVIIVGIVMAGIPFFYLRRHFQTRIVITTTFLLLVFFLMARFSYAGLRLLDLLTFAVPYALMRAIGRSEGRLSRKAKVSLCIAGVVGAAFLYRNMIVELRLEHLSPFLPYKFFWE